MVFSLLADECRDSAGQTKLALFFRYVWKDVSTGKYSGHKDFTQFFHYSEPLVKLSFKLLWVVKMVDGVHWTKANLYS